MKGCHDFELPGKGYDPYRALACNVIYQAASDLRKEIRRIAVRKQDINTRRANIKMIKHFFFKSPWLEVVNVDGKEIYRKIVKEENYEE